MINMFDNRLLKILEAEAAKERLRKQPKIRGIVKDKKQTKNNNLILIVEKGKNEEAVLVNKNREDLFSIGVTAAKPDSFVISEGSDLNSPIFVFSGDKIGVGILDPKANLNVSGNSGFLATGELGSTEPLAATGQGSR